MTHAIDQWEAEEAAKQMAILRGEEEAFAALSAEDQARINKERRDRLTRFAEAVEKAEAEAGNTG